MTLRQLAARLNAIVAENKDQGWDDRNDLPAVVEIRRRGASGRLLQSHFVDLGEALYASSCQLGAYGREFCGVITVPEAAVLTMARERDEKRRAERSER